MLESPPKRFIQNSCVSTITGGTPGPSSLGRVSRPEHGREPHDLEEVAGDEAHVDADGVVVTLKGADHGEYSAMPPSDLAPLRKSRTSGTEKSDVRSPGPSDRLPQVDQPIAVAVGQRLEQHAADDAEDRGVGADAERQRDHDHRGERGAVSQRAQGVP